MPYYLFTLHAFRSWGPDHEDGFVQRGEAEVKRPDEDLAARRDSRATHPAVIFTRDQMNLLVDEAQEACRRRDCCAHAAAAVGTHVHIVASWSKECTAGTIQEGLKSGLGYCLSKALGGTGHRWFSRGGVPEPVEDHAHLFRLKHDYLPRHASEQGGVYRNFDAERETADGTAKSVGCERSR